MRALSRAWQILLKAIPRCNPRPGPWPPPRWPSSASPTPPTFRPRTKPCAALREDAAAGGEGEPRQALPPTPPAPVALAGAAPGPRTARAAAGPGRERPACGRALAPPPARPAPTPRARARREAGPEARAIRDVVALADARRDILMKAALERDVHLVRFEEGRIELRLAAGGRPSLANDLSASLTAWTGRRWSCGELLSQEDGAPTLAENSRMASETRRENAAADPFVREALTRFPGAEIVDVRETAMDSGATAEEEILGDVDAARVEETESDDLRGVAGNRPTRHLILRCRGAASKVGPLLPHGATQDEVFRAGGAGLPVRHDRWV